MKKICLFIVAVLSCLSHTHAQGWAKPVHSGAGTNVYQRFTFDNNNHPVIIGGAEDYSAGTPNGLAFMKLDKTSGSRSLLKKYNGNTNSESFKIHTDAEGNIYYFGTFMDYIAFGTDTLYTYDKQNWNRPNFILAKFDSEGNHIWSKKFGRKFNVEFSQVLDAHFAGNKFHVMLSFSADSVFYENAFLEKLPYISTYVYNYCLLKVNLSDGSLETFKKIGSYYDNYPQLFAVKENGNYEIGVMDFSSQKKFIVYSFTETTAPAVKCSTLITDQSNGYGYDIENGVWLNGHYYLLGVNNQTATGGSVYGSDSVKILVSPHNLRNGVIMRFDSTMKLKNYVRFHWREDYPKLFLSKGKLVVPTRFSNTMYMESDSVVCANNQQAWEVMAFNEDLTIADTLQVNTANSSGGSFDLVCAGYDNNGNLYAQVVHNKAIQYYGTVVNASLKSWDHITVLVRKGENLGTGINNHATPLRVSVYPNPASEKITIDTKVTNVVIFNATGQQLIRSGSPSIDVSMLPPGVYFIRATNGTEHFYSRFTRN